jgi:hypothetical protein
MQRERANLKASVILEHELPGACFCKIQNLNSEKNQKKYQSVVYHLFYLCVNLFYEIPCILFSAKMTKFQIWEHICRSENMFQKLSNLSFLLSLQYKVFDNKNLHGHSIRSWLHPHIFLQIFATLKCRF